MTDWREPLPDRPPDERDEERDDEREPREPDMSDPEAQRAPGDDSTGQGVPGETPPMRAAAGG